MDGLMAYLVGPGRTNEHTEPHLVAGDSALMAWYDDNELAHKDALAIARHLDQPHKVFDVEVSGGHVWHCSLSVPAHEGQLGDQKWAAIAHDFVREMGFDDNEGTKAPCRWVAVHHGESKNGNDHIHLAVNLVREDGTKASVHNDFSRAQKAARALEVQHDLEPLESAGQERGTRGYHPAERAAQARLRAQAKHEYERRGAQASQPEWSALSANERERLTNRQMREHEPRQLLALRVRGCATAANDEAEFVRRLRRAGLLVRPRYAEGRTDVIVGYSVALRPEYGEAPTWYGGGRLGRDLTLPRLRQEWPDSPHAASEAAAEWNAAKRGRRVARPGREAQEIPPEVWQQCQRDLDRLRHTLSSVSPEDRQTWVQVARHGAGVLASWSSAVESEPGHLAAASRALAKSAQTYRDEPRPRKETRVALSGAAMVLATAAAGGRGAVGQAVMLRQMVRVTQALHDATRASGQARRAAQIADAERAHLRQVAARLPKVASKQPAPVSPTVEPVRTLGTGSPVPTHLQSHRRGAAVPTADRGIDR